MSQRHEILKGLLNAHLEWLKGFPLEKILKADPDLHAELLQASRQVDKAYFHEDLGELIKAISATQNQYLSALQKYFGNEVSRL